MKRQIITLLSFIILLTGIQNSFSDTPPKREVRAVWLTTIGGLDWPRSKAYNSESILRQQKELTDILDKLQAAHFNTVLLQTRIRSTVIYPSAIEPWDDCLTGHAGKDPGYDPLKFAIDECHKRHIELHAWVVAFPGNNDRQAKTLGRQAIQRRLQKLCMRANDFWMLNPGEPETADYLASICREITQNYDVDGINLDYIRYPETEIHYNDLRTYRRYGHGKRLAEWRSENVTRCVKTIHDAVKAVKPWVRLSCSPIGKFDDLPRYSSKGWNAFTIVYQDAQGWLRDGLMDMLVPMMYFEDNHFFPFAQDWAENSYGRIIVPGLGAYFLEDASRDWPLATIQREDYVLRTLHTDGQAYFRSRFVTENAKGIYDFLKGSFYTSTAFTPALTWQKPNKPTTPQKAVINLDSINTRLTWNGSSEDGVTYNVYTSPTYPIDIDDIRNLKASGLKQPVYSLGVPWPVTLLPYIAVTAMDRYGNESEPAGFNFPSTAIDTGALYVGPLSLDGEQLILPPREQKEFVYITDASECEVLLKPYQQYINIHSLTPGLYTVRSLEAKGRAHCLGKFLKR